MAFYINGSGEKVYGEFVLPVWPIDRKLDVYRLQIGVHFVDSEEEVQAVVPSEIEEFSITYRDKVYTFVSKSVYLPRGERKLFLLQLADGPFKRSEIELIVNEYNAWKVSQ